MTVVLYFVASLAYLFFAGFGFTRLVLKDHPSRDSFILANGFSLTIVVFSEACIFCGSAFLAFILTIAMSLVLNVSCFLWGDSRIRPGTFNTKRSSRLFRSRLSVYFLATVVVVFVAWSFFYSGWEHFWGSANEDIFDGLYGRDAFLRGKAEEVALYLNPLVRNQYSSLAFWSILLQAFNRMNVFHLQGILMIFIQVQGIYLLSRTGFRFGHSVSLLSASLGTCGAFYISTFFTGHEGSLVFAGIVPFILCFGLHVLRSNRVYALSLVALGLWLYLLVHTYIFPLGFSLIPLLLTTVYWRLLRSESRLQISQLIPRWMSLTEKPLSARPFVILALGATSILVCLGTYPFVNQLWHFVEPIRSRAFSTYRAWGIAHFKEMILIYWGFLPSSIPFGSIPNPAKLGNPYILTLAYILAIAVVLLMLGGLRRLFSQRSLTSTYFAFFAVCWILYFVFMKYVIVDSYYLYKYLYTQYFVGGILLAYSLKEFIPGLRLPSNIMRERVRKYTVVLILGSYVLSNLVYIVLYNIDVCSRPYNSKESRVADISPLKSYLPSGIFFNLSQFDYQYLLEYVFRASGFPRAELTSTPFGYELEVKGVEDILLRDPETRKLEWENEIYQLYRAKKQDYLLVQTNYQGEHYPSIYDGHPFRWVKDRVTLKVVNPSLGPHFLMLCAETGPGLAHEPLYLHIVVNGIQVDSTLVQDLRSAMVELPPLKQRVNEIRIFSGSTGRNFLPWEERYLNYRVAIIGIPNDRFPTESMKILNNPADIITPRTWEVLKLAPSSWKDTSDLLLVGNNWNPVEHDGVQVLRWVNNDAQFLIFNPTAGSHQLKLTVEKGPSLRGLESRIHVLVNGRGVDTIALGERKTVLVALPELNSGVNFVTLHADKVGIPGGRDPRVLNFMVLNAQLIRQAGIAE